MQARLEVEPCSHLFPMEFSYIQFLHNCSLNVCSWRGGRHTFSFRRLLYDFYSWLHNLRLTTFLAQTKEKKKKKRSSVFQLQAHLWHFKLHRFQLALTSHWFFKHIFPIVSSTQFSDCFAKENNAWGIKAKCNAAVQQWNKEVKTEIKNAPTLFSLKCLNHDKHVISSVVSQKQ